MDKFQKNNKIYNLICSMVNELIKNSNQQNPGFPVVAAYANENWDVLSISVNSRSENKKTDHKNHAEFKCLSNIPAEVKNNLILIVTIPPCSNCFNEILKINLINIYCFFDEIQKKLNKSYLKKSNIKITKISLKDFKNPTIKFGIYYIVVSYLEGCLTQKISYYSRKKIMKIYKKYLLKLKEQIKSNNISKKDIQINEVWSMIEFVSKINIEEINHMKIKKIKWIIPRNLNHK